MPIRMAEARWNGRLRDGTGTLQLPAYDVALPYSAGSRFQDAAGSNPEELIGAAHAGCFSMAFAGELEKAGYPPTYIHTTARVSIDRTGDGFTITRIALETIAGLPRLDNATFQGLAQAAKEHCPVSRALGAVPEITLVACWEEIAQAA
jgi:osmotically inducible protein OsmC